LVAALSVADRRILWVVYSTLALGVLAGCGSLHPGYPGGDLVGHVGVSGPNVTLNDAPAANGAAVREGGRLATGTSSSAILEYYNGGGKLQLDADSAATFRKERTAPGVCSRVELTRGQAWVRADEGCGVELRALDYVLRVDGRANVVLNDERFEVTVNKGRALLSKPEQLELRAGQSYSDAAPGARDLEKSESQARLAWLEPYAFQGWCCFGRNVMPASRMHCLPPEFSFDEATLTMKCKHKDGGPLSIFGRRSRR
jgi:hypothetical protein